MCVWLTAFVADELMVSSHVPTLDVARAFFRGRKWKSGDDSEPAAGNDPVTHSSLILNIPSSRDSAYEMWKYQTSINTALHSFCEH